MFETCPLLDEISWIKHGFFDSSNPVADLKNFNGLHLFTDDYPPALFLRQTHSDLFIDTPKDAENPADAAVTDQTGLPLAIKTADCCPILLVCTHSRQIAAVHSGWRGAMNRITEKMIREMIQRGAKADHIVTAIGPNIAQENFAVQDDVRNQFPADAMDFFIPFEDRWKMDVAGIIRQQIKQTGVNQIWQSSTDTYTALNYFSYRRFTKGLSPFYGSNISIINKINP